MSKRNMCKDSTATTDATETEVRLRAEEKPDLGRPYTLVNAALNIFSVDALDHKVAHRSARTSVSTLRPALPASRLLG